MSTRAVDYKVLGGVGSGSIDRMLKINSAAINVVRLRELSFWPNALKIIRVVCGAFLGLVVLVPASLSCPPGNTPASVKTPDFRETKASALAGSELTGHSVDHSQPVNWIVSQATDSNPGNSAPVSNQEGSGSSGGADSGDKPVPVKKKTKPAKKNHSNTPVAPSAASEAGNNPSVSSSMPPRQKDPPAQSEAQASLKTGDSEAAELEELERDVDQLSGRAAAAADSLDDIRRQQSSQGLAMRGDIVTAQELVRTNLDKAQQALQDRDVKNARKYMERAQPNLEKIEKFLGR
jgi:hypothetical protein